MDIEKLDLDIIRQIAFTQTDTDERDNRLTELLFREIYYYSKDPKKILDVTPTLSGMKKFLDLLISSLDRMTDLLDALYLAYSTESNGESSFEKTHKELFNELGGHRRRTEDIEKLYQDASVKISTYYKNTKCV